MMRAQFLLAGILIVAFVLGSHAGAQTSIISDVSIAMTGQDTGVCATIPLTPEATITHWQDFRFKCQYRCDNDPPGYTDCGDSTVRVTATGKCGQISCLPVIGTPSDSVEGSAPNQQHKFSGPYQNRIINGTGQCVPSTESAVERFVDVIYEEESCSAEACPGQEQEISECEAGESTWWNYTTCECVTSPVLLDMDGDGFSLSEPDRGVKFDLNRDGTRELVSWPTARSRDGFLVLDRDGNGTIDHGGELFGSTTDQPKVRKLNGYLALAVFDTAEAGGNRDGSLTGADEVFSSLRVWFDLNMDGTSQTHELHTLGSLGILDISFDYTMSRDIDSRSKNMLLYRSTMKVRNADGHGTSIRPTVDVFLRAAKVRW